MPVKYKDPECQFYLEEDHAVTIGAVPNKITGTAMAGILGFSPFQSEFTVACALLNIGREILDGKFAIEFGKAHESTIIKYISEMNPDVGIFVPAEDLFEERKGDHDKWKSDFDDDTFGGHVDGLVYDENGDEFILEIKTTSIDHEADWKDWNGNYTVPDYYRCQVELYNHFIAKKDHAFVAVGFRDKNDKIETWKPTEENTHLIRMEIDQEAFDEKLEDIKAWYARYILAGITPDYNILNEKDVTMWEHLSSITGTADQMQVNVDNLEAVEEKIALKENEIADLYTARDDLRKMIKDYMVSNNVTEIPTNSGKYKAVITQSVRKTIDANALRADGIDPTRYTLVKTVDSFTLKQITKDITE